jgi:rhodanese-related sulfurtransferase
MAEIVKIRAVSYAIMGPEVSVSCSQTSLIEQFEMSVLTRLKKRFWWLPFGHVPEIDADELNALLNGRGPLKIIDVRTSAEWRRSHIPGAVRVPVSELKARIASLQLDAQQPIIAICLSAHRSIPAVRLLHAQGFENAVQLKGGMLAWWSKNYPTEHAGRK